VTPKTGGRPRRIPRAVPSAGGTADVRYGFTEPLRSGSARSVTAGTGRPGP
jgi:hypothetical protein